jgi:hypothetical protein
MVGMTLVRATRLRVAVDALDVSTPNSGFLIPAGNEFSFSIHDVAWHGNEVDAVWTPCESVWTPCGSVWTRCDSALIREIAPIRPT